MKLLRLFCLSFCLLAHGMHAQAIALSEYTDNYSISDRYNYVENNGLVILEAEHFATQHQVSKRKWFRFSQTSSPHPFADSDTLHYANASGGQYIEVLPDTRTNHFEALVQGENFSNIPGIVAVLSYPIWFETPGQYYVWARAFSTGSEDNGVHVGLNGEWPASAQRLQWCQGKHQWTWSSAQRTKNNHCGKPNTITLHIDRPGMHTLNISMREDGLELDALVLTKDANYHPDNQALMPTLATPESLPHKNRFLGINNYTRIFDAHSDFEVSASSPNQHIIYRTSITRRDAGKRHMTLVSGEDIQVNNEYHIFQNDTLIATLNHETATKIGDEYYHFIAPRDLNKGDTLSVNISGQPAVTNPSSVNANSNSQWRALVLSREKNNE